MANTSEAPQKYSGAFTLIELLVVMAIMAVVLGISVYHFRRGEVRQDLRAAADDIKAAWGELQTRALAGSPTPPDAVRQIGTFTVASGGRATTGYGLLLYGTQRMPGFYAVFYPEDPRTSDDPEDAGFLPGQNVIDQPFVMLGCATILTPRPGRCWVTLPEYSPVLPPNTYIDKATIELAPSSTSNTDGTPTYQFTTLVQDQNAAPYFHFRDPPDRLNFETCRPGSWPRYDSMEAPPVGDSPEAILQRFLFMGIRAPQPTYMVNGWVGCEVVRFALRSNLDQAMPESQRGQLWVQFDLRTGRISTADEESGLPDRS